MGDDSTVGLKILIEGDASGAVAASGQAKDALTGVAGAASTGAESTKELGKSTEDAGDKVNAFNTHGRAFHALIHEADRIVPGLGLALRACFNPNAIGIFAMVMILKTLVEHFKENAKAAAELRDAIASTDASVWQAHIDGVINLRKEYAGYAEEIRKANIDPQVIEKKYAREKVLMDAKIDQQKKLNALLGLPDTSEKDKAAGDIGLLEKKKREDQMAAIAADDAYKAALAVQAKGDPNAAAAARAADQKALADKTEKKAEDALLIAQETLQTLRVYAEKNPVDSHAIPFLEKEVESASQDVQAAKGEQMNIAKIIEKSAQTVERQNTTVKEALAAQLRYTKAMNDAASAIETQTAKMAIDQSGEKLRGVVEDLQYFGLEWKAIQEIIKNLR